VEAAPGSDASVPTICICAEVVGTAQRRLGPPYGLSASRPCESRDPYAAASLWAQWLTASAPTKAGGYGSLRSQGRRPARPAHHRHTPRMRGIQYAAPSPFNHRCLWNTGSPAFAGDDNASALSSFSPCGRRCRGRSPRRMRGPSPRREPLTRLRFAKPPSPTRGEGIPRMRRECVTSQPSKISWPRIQTQLRDLAAQSARGLLKNLPPQSKGAGNAGRWARPQPCVQK
jgi:hypothetical protein